MKECKLVYLNKGLKFSRDKDLAQAEETINRMLEEGWELKEICTPDDGVGAMVGVFFRERKL